MSRTTLIRFGEFEVDFAAWALHRDNIRIPLQRKPFQILRLLLSRPGELVTRAELARELWPDLHVNYDRSLNTAVNALRHALNEPPRAFRFIETRPGVGYRFAGSTTISAGPESDATKQHAAEPDLALGYYFLHRCSSDSITRARACFTAVVESDPTQPAGHVALAELECFIALWGHAPTRDASHRALLHAQAACSIHPHLPETRAAHLVASTLNNGAYHRAITQSSSLFQQASSTISARLWFAEFLCLCGRAAEAIEHLQIARRVNPISLLVRSRLSLALYFSGNYQAAVEHAWAALAIEPACAELQHVLALAYQRLGFLDEAVIEFENAATCSGGGSAPLAGLYHALHSAGRPAEAALIAAQLTELANSSYVSHCWHALAHATSGNRAAFEQALLMAADAGDCLLTFARYDPRFATAGSVAAAGA